MGKINTIIWDWNGTLLNDTNICVDAMNEMLTDRKREKITRDHYKEIFTFPVRDYYDKLGFNFDSEDWNIVAVEFMDKYFEKFPSTKLHNNVVETLEEVRKKGFRQVILSAMQKESLINSVKEKGLDGFFDVIAGIEDHYAHSKLDVARELMKKEGLNAGEICLIGDSLHDFEVSSELGCMCILIANGHQTKDRLIPTNCIVFDEITDILEVIKLL